MQKTGHRQSRLPSNIDTGIHDLLDALPYSAQLIDSDHKILAVNETLKQAVGMDEDRLIGEHCTVVIHGLNVPPADCPLEEALETRKPIERDLFNSEKAEWIRASVYPTPILTMDGRPTYLHFLRDITEVKNAAADLSKNLEHHKALCDLLQNLQYCQNSTQILDVLIDQVLSLSWLGMATTAVGFLLKDSHLELISHRNISQELLERCRHLAMGECLCGKVIEKDLPMICSSKNHDHSIKYEGMAEHHHVVFPIRHKGNPLGVLTLYLNPEDEMDDFRLGFLNAATTAAGAALDGQLAREQAHQAQEKCLALVISSQEDERKRIAGDLHDQLCQSLSAILLEMQSNKSQGDTTRFNNSGIENQIRDLIDQVRRMAGQLRPSLLDDFGLESALARKIEEISNLKDIPVHFQCAPSGQRESRLPIEMEVGLYRITIEALLNAVTHAAASHISVILMRQKNTATILIEDDGCGFDVFTIRKNLDRCRGLIEMEERMNVLGGKLQVESFPGKGTTIRAELPLGTKPQTT